MHVVAAATELCPKRVNVQCATLVAEHQWPVCIANLRLPALLVLLQVAVELAELRGVITQQAAQLSQLSRLLLDSQAQLADSKEAEAQTQKQLHHREAELTAKVRACVAL